MPSKSQRKLVQPTSHWRAGVLAAGGLLAFAGLTWSVLQGFTAPKVTSETSAGQGIVGMRAPGLALPASTGGQVALDQFRGSKVVVYFYEGAG